jgi:hypothetical protein
VIQLDQHEGLILRSVFRAGIADAEKRNPDGVRFIMALWNKLQRECACQHDTDGDGDCHLCFESGGCEFRKPL